MPLNAKAHHRSSFLAMALALASILSKRLINVSRSPAVKPAVRLPSHSAAMATIASSIASAFRVT
jgi:hypothetical protein